MSLWLYLYIEYNILLVLLFLWRALTNIPSQPSAEARTMMSAEERYRALNCIGDWSLYCTRQNFYNWKWREGYGLYLRGCATIQNDLIGEYWDLGATIERNQNVSCLFSNRLQVLSNLVTYLTLSHKRFKIIYKKPFKYNGKWKLG